MTNLNIIVSLSSLSLSKWIIWICFKFVSTFKRSTHTDKDIDNVNLYCWWKCLLLVSLDHVHRVVIVAFRFLYILLVFIVVLNTVEIFIESTVFVWDLTLPMLHLIKSTWLVPYLFSKLLLGIFKISFCKHVILIELQSNYCSFDSYLVYFCLFLLAL